MARVSMKIIQRMTEDLYVFASPLTLVQTVHPVVTINYFYKNTIQGKYKIRVSSVEKSNSFMDRKIRYWKEKGKEKKVTNYRDHLQTIGQTISQFCLVYCTRIKWYYSFALVNF